MIGYVYLIPRYFSKAFYKIYNRIKFKAFGFQLGKNNSIANKVELTLKRGGKACAGVGLSIQSHNSFNPLTRNMTASIYVGSKGTLSIGDHVGISSTCIWCIESITIGNYVKIGAHTVIMDNDAHNLNAQIRRNSAKDVAASKPIIIGNDVLIGTGCTILKGVIIGDNTIIGAGSVVTKSIPANCIAAGNPCKVIKQNERN